MILFVKIIVVLLTFHFILLCYSIIVLECFDMRMERTALYAIDNGFRYFTTTNATSRWKDVKQVNESGIRGEWTTIFKTSIL